MIVTYHYSHGTISAQSILSICNHFLNFIPPDMTFLPETDQKPIVKTREFFTKLSFGAKNAKNDEITVQKGGSDYQHITGIRFKKHGNKPHKYAK